jgi:HEAT repeat protein
MSVHLQPETQNLVDTLLYDKDQSKRREVLKTVNALADKAQVEKYLLERFDNEEDRWRRTWTLTVLSEIGMPDGKQKILAHAAESQEPDPWVRHFALINAANFDPFPKAEIEAATNDTDVLPKAMALRVLLAHGEDHYSDELMDMLMDENVSDARWAAARALRNRSDVKMKAMRARIEDGFIPCLVELAADPNIYLDTRWEAVQALASFKQQKAVATQLANLLVEDEDPILRRYYLEALTSLHQPDETQNALLLAVEDPDAQIRLDAANALSKMIGTEKSIKLLLPLALEREQDTALLVDALRHISPDLAAKEIRDALSDPDVQVSTRAYQLLTMLGGQAATQILMSERAKALDRYTDILSDADKDVRDHFKELMSQAKVSFWMSLIMHSIVFGIGVAVLIASMVVAFGGGPPAVSAWIGVGGAGASALTILLSAFYRNPLRNVRGSLNALMQVDVIFLGYVRQINQIDATFKHMFLDARDFGTAQMQTTVAEIQASVKDILDQIQKHILDK